MVEYAFINIDTYLEFFKEIGEIHKAKENTLKNIISEIESKYADLLEGKSKKQEEFLVPEIPKIKKEPKDKSELSRASRSSRRNPSVLNNNTVDLQQNDSEVIRRSSRIASKTKLKPNIASQNSTKSESGFSNDTYIVSPSHIPVKIRRTDDEKSKQTDREHYSALEKTLCVESMNTPLGSSTPTLPSSFTPEKVNKLVDEQKKKSDTTENKNATPSNTKCTVKGESVKKKIEDFEKRAKGDLQPVKLLSKNIEKSKITVSSKINSKVSKTKKEITIENGKRNKESIKSDSKILQEIKLPNEKVLEAVEKKKAAAKKAMEETKRRREERERKVAIQREAAEKEKQLAAMKLEKEREEKSKLLQKTKDEEILKKKQTAALKAAELEERRKQEKAAKLAKLKKTVMTQKEATKEVPQYNIDGVLEGDSSEDEDKPKRQIPTWATKEAREYPLNVQAWLNKKKTVYRWFYDKNLKYPKLEELFSGEVKTRPRTSSAVWNSRICFNESFPLI